MFLFSGCHTVNLNQEQIWKYIQPTREQSLRGQKVRNETQGKVGSILKFGTRICDLYNSLTEWGWNVQHG